MSTLTDLQRNKCNILPREIITHDPSITQWNYPSLYCIKPEEEKKYKGLIAHTNARKHTNTFSNDYFYPCYYFPPQMHPSGILQRLHVQFRAVGSG